MKIQSGPKELLDRKYWYLKINFRKDCTLVAKRTDLKSFQNRILEQRKMTLMEKLAKWKWNLVFSECISVRSSVLTNVRQGGKMITSGDTGLGLRVHRDHLYCLCDFSVNLISSPMKCSFQIIQNKYSMNKRSKSLQRRWCNLLCWSSRALWNPVWQRWCLEICYSLKWVDWAESQAL